MENQINLFIFVLFFNLLRHQNKYVFKNNILPIVKTNSQSVGFEPTLPEGIWFLVRRLNHSATTARRYLHTIRTIGSVVSARGKNSCQEWDLNPRPEDRTATWTQRLGPLGHPDRSYNLVLVDYISYWRGLKRRVLGDIHQLLLSFNSTAVIV